MMDTEEQQDAAWDDWEEGEEHATEAAGADVDANAGADWVWDMAALEANVALVEEASGDASCWTLGEPSAVGGRPGLGEDASAEDTELLELALAAPGVHQALGSDRRKLEALSALAKVAKAHLLAVRSGFATLAAGEEGAARGAEGTHTSEQIDAEIAALTSELCSMAGDWAASISAWTREDGERLEEMASALQHSLAASGEDLSLFQQVAEQLFASLPDRSVRVSVEWIHPVEGVSGVDTKETVKTEASGYLRRLLAMMADGGDAVQGATATTSHTTQRPTRVPVLTDAEIFQDAKDVARDELAVHGEVIAGSIGYDAVVDHIQTQLEQLVAVEIGKPLPQFSMQLSDTLHRIAMEVLNASNRTESGGSAYEVLGRFMTNHEMDRVLIRPASAKAPPIQIDMDMGPYVSTEGLGAVADASSWCFGVRVTLTAVTWYLVCDATDPTVELYEVKTTYRNRLAFPIGLTPFHPINHMRKDRGAVDLQLTLPESSPSDPKPKQSQEQEQDARVRSEEAHEALAGGFEAVETPEEDAVVAYDELL